MPTQPLRIMILGAHPDDADIKAGGTAAKWSALGHTVFLVSLCDGGAGHQTERRPALVERRRAEAHAAARVIGATYKVMDEPDGELQPTLEVRRKLIRLIRTFVPDLVITHRTVDYHPDHCYTGQLVQEAAYMLTVPAICPETPHLFRMPVIMYFSDAFKQPSRFEPHVVVDVTGEMDQIIAMLDCHESQFYEWLPYNLGLSPEQVPTDPSARRAGLSTGFKDRIGPLTKRYREQVIATYGEDRGASIEFIEAFQLSEFGSPLDAETYTRLFPFLPAESKLKSNFTKRVWVDIPDED